MNALLKIAEHVNNRISNTTSLTMGIFGSHSELLKKNTIFLTMLVFIQANNSL